MIFFRFFFDRRSNRSNRNGAILLGTFPLHPLGSTMAKTSPQEITLLLQAWGNGDSTALEALTPLVYAELHRLAKSYMSKERPGHVLSTTDVVNEAYTRLIDWKNASWQNRAHFFAVSARFMRQILVDFARKYQREDGRRRVSNADLLGTQDTDTDLVALDEALKALEELDTRKSKIVELRFFGGLSEKETAEVLTLSRATVTREWKKAKAWLLLELSQEGC